MSRPRRSAAMAAAALSGIRLSIFRSASRGKPTARIAGAVSFKVILGKVILGKAILGKITRKRFASMFKFSRFAVTATGFLALGTGVACGQTVIPTYNGIDSDTMIKVIIGAAPQSQVTPDLTDPKGPILKVQMPGGVAYNVMMDDCDGASPNLCRSLEFHATLPPAALNFSQINSFNETMRYATAYLSDKGVPQLRMDANLRGGVTANFIAYDVRIFVKLIGDYVQQAK